MAHKTLIGGTSYDISGGKTLVGGTAYSVKNGKVLIGGTAYDISFVLPPAVLDLWSGPDAKIESIIYANGYWIVGGYYNDGSTCYARIAYATELNGTWTIKDLWSTSSGKGSHIYDIAYGDGYFVVLGDYASGSGLRARIAYATDLTGTWVTNDLWSDSIRSVYCIEYGNGYWAVGGTILSSNRYYGRIAYTTDISSAYSNWSSKNLWNNANYLCPVKDILYANGYWYAAGINYSPTSPRGMLARSPSFTDSFVSEIILSDSDSASLEKIICENGYLVAVGYSAGSIIVAYSTSLTSTGGWTKKGIGDYVTRLDLIYADGYFVVTNKRQVNSVAYQEIIIAASPSDSWQTITLGENSGYGSNIMCIAYGNGCWAVGGEVEDGDMKAHLSYAANLNDLTW